MENEFGTRRCPGLAALVMVAAGLGGAAPAGSPANMSVRPRPSSGSAEGITWGNSDGGPKTLKDYRNLLAKRTRAPAKDRIALKTIKPGLSKIKLPADLKADTALTMPAPPAKEGHDTRAKKVRHAMHRGGITYSPGSSLGTKPSGPLPAKAFRTAVKEARSKTIDADKLGRRATERLEAYVRKKQAESLQAEYMKRANKLYQQKRYEDAFQLYYLARGPWIEVRTLEGDRVAYVGNLACKVAHSRMKKIVSVLAKPGQQYGQARRAMKKRRWEEAYRCFKRVVDSDAPDSFKARFAEAAMAAMADIEQAAKALLAELRRALAAEDAATFRKNHTSATREFRGFRSFGELAGVFRSLCSAPECGKLLREAEALEALVGAEELLRRKQAMNAFAAYRKLTERYGGSRASAAAEAKLAALRADKAFMAQVHAEEVRGMMSMARAYEQNAMRDLAVATYQAIVRDHARATDTSAAREALKRLGASGVSRVPR